MKGVIKPIYCGISGKKDESGKFKFRIDFDNNTSDDVIQFNEPYFYQSDIDDNVYWFGYRFNGKVDKEYRDQFLEYLKNVQWAPELEDEFDEFEYDPDMLSDADLTKMIRRSLNNININSYNIDTVVYPLSSSNELVRSIVSCMSRILRNADRLTYVEVVKSDPARIEFDVAACLHDLSIGRLQDPKGIITEDYLNSLIDRIHRQTSFSLRRDIQPMSLRPYVSNFIDMAQVAKKVETAANILIVDDIKTTGSTIREIIDVIRRYNDEANIYIFTLLGKK